MTINNERFSLAFVWIYYFCLSHYPRGQVVFPGMNLNRVRSFSFVEILYGPREIIVICGCLRCFIHINRELIAVFIPSMETRSKIKHTILQYVFVGHTRIRISFSLGVVDQLALFHLRKMFNVCVRCGPHWSQMPCPTVPVRNVCRVCE